MQPKTLCGPRRLSVFLALLCTACAFAIFRELLLRRPDLFLLFRSAPRPRLFSRAAAAATASRAAPRAALPAAAPPPAAAAPPALTAEHLLAALAPLLPNGTMVDALAIERVIDVLLHAGALPSEHGPPYAAPPPALRRPVRVVQFGANSGDSENDPLWHRINVTERSGAALEAVLVEPVPHLYARLARNYAPWARSVATLWGAACGRDARPGSTLPFIGFRENASAYEYYNSRQKQRVRWPEAFQQLGSFSKRFLLHLTAASEEELAIATVVHQVPCVSVRSVMCGRGWGAGSVDYLHIDAEGFDDQVLYASEVEITRPLIVRLEAQHIDGPSAVKHLEERGYRVMHMCAKGPPPPPRLRAPRKQPRIHPPPHTPPTPTHRTAPLAPRANPLSARWQEGARRG